MKVNLINNTNFKAGIKLENEHFYKFRGWQDGEGNFITKIPTGSFGNIHLTAVWYGENVFVYTYTTSKTVNVAYAIMQLPSTDFTSNCHITVTGSCKQLYIITGNSNITYTMYITIEEISETKTTPLYKTA